MSQQQPYHIDLTTRSNKREHSYKIHNPVRRTKLERPMYLRNNIYLYIYIVILILASIVSRATSYGLDDRGVRVQVLVRSRIFSSSCRPDRLWSPPDFLSSGYQGIKRPGRDADHSPQASTKVKKMWIYTSTHPYAFMA
jgi:hypothetical protein